MFLMRFSPEQPWALGGWRLSCTSLGGLSVCKLAPAASLYPSLCHLSLFMPLTISFPPCVYFFLRLSFWLSLTFISLCLSHLPSLLTFFPSSHSNDAELGEAC